MVADLEGLIKFLGHVYGILESHTMPRLDSLVLDENEAPESEAPESEQSQDLKAVIRKTVETLTDMLDKIA